MDEKRLEELTEGLSDRLDAMSEEAFDLSAVDAYLDAMEKVCPVASDFDVKASKAEFIKKHRGLFPGRKKMRGWRLAGRVAAIAAVVTVSSAVVATAMGVDVFGFFGRWGRAEFWFPGTASNRPQAEAAVTGDFKSLQAALDANGIQAAMAPQWTPEGLRERAIVSQEEQRTLFAAEYRDQQGRGYTIELERRLGAPALMLPKGTGATEYVCDGYPYILVDVGDGVMRAFWTRENFYAKLEGELDGDTLREILRSVTGGVYTPPSPGWDPAGNDVQSMLSVFHLDPNLAPTWFPEGYEKTDICAEISGEISGVQAIYTDTAKEKQIFFHVEWWEEIEPVRSEFEGFEDVAAVSLWHNDVEFQVQESDGKRLVTWISGPVSGYLWGDMTQEEAEAIVNSIPVWSDEKPEEPEQPQQNHMVRGTYDSMADALEAYGLDTALVPTVVPEGYTFDKCETAEFRSGDLSVDAMYMNEEETLYRVSLRTYPDEERAQNSYTYMKDDNPVVEYEHNGITYYIMSNLEYRTVAWKDGLLEGSIGGIFTVEEAKEIVDSIAYSAAAE